MDKGTILEIQPIGVADELNEWMVIQEERQNEDDIYIWGFSNWLVILCTGMENAMWGRFSGENQGFSFGHVSFEIPIKYPGQVLRHTSMEFNEVGRLEMRIWKSYI